MKCFKPINTELFIGFFSKIEELSLLQIIASCDWIKLVPALYIYNLNLSDVKREKDKSERFRS